MTGASRLLVVEDNALNMKLLRDLLHVTGYTVLEARSGEDAVSLARTGAPDLVLMDVQLPGIDGVETLALLRRDPRTASIPVVALTALAMPAERARLLEAGFDDYLPKPVDIAQLLTVVSRHCARA